MPAELPRQNAEWGRGRGAAARDMARAGFAHRPTPRARPMPDSKEAEMHGLNSAARPSRFRAKRRRLRGAAAPRNPQGLAASRRDKVAPLPTRASAPAGQLCAAAQLEAGAAPVRMTERSGRRSSRRGDAGQSEPRAESAPPPRAPTPTSYQQATSHRARFLDEETLVRPREKRAPRAASRKVLVP